MKGHTRADGILFFFALSFNKKVLSWVVPMCMYIQYNQSWKSSHQLLLRYIVTMKARAVISSCFCRHRHRRSVKHGEKKREILFQTREKINGTKATPLSSSTQKINTANFFSWLAISWCSPPVCTRITQSRLPKKYGASRIGTNAHRIK